MGAAGIGALIGAGVGVAKSNENRERERQTTELAAAKTEAAPLLSEGNVGGTGTLQFGPSQFDSLMQGAISGASFGAKNKNLFGKQEKVKDDKALG